MCSWQLWISITSYRSKNIKIDSIHNTHSHAHSYALVHSFIFGCKFIKEEAKRRRKCYFIHKSAMETYTQIQPWVFTMSVVRLLVRSGCEQRRNSLVRDSECSMYFVIVWDPNDHLPIPILDCFFWNATVPIELLSTTFRCELFPLAFICTLHEV